jgi:hypothetical protein
MLQRLLWLLRMPWMEWSQWTPSRDARRRHPHSQSNSIHHRSRWPAKCRWLARRSSGHTDNESWWCQHPKHPRPRFGSGRKPILRCRLRSKGANCDGCRPEFFIRWHGEPGRIPRRRRFRHEHRSAHVRRRRRGGLLGRRRFPWWGRRRRGRGRTSLIERARRWFLATPEFREGPFHRQLVPANKLVDSGGFTFRFQPSIGTELLSG